MGLKILMILGVLILFSSSVSAVSCNYNQINVNYDNENSHQLTITCGNQQNSSVTLTTSGENNYFSINPSIINPESSQNIIINFLSAIPKGMHYGFISFSDGTNIIPITFNVSQKETNTCSPTIFPTSMSNIKIQQGEQKTRYVQLTLPSCYTSEINIQGVILQTDEKPLKLGELSLGKLNPGNSVQIPIELDARGVSVGTYSDILQFLVYDVSGNRINLPSVSINVLVTSGISPVSNFTMDMLPSCSLSNTIIGLNGTSTFTCTLNNPNFDVKPRFDTQYIKGVSVSKTSTQYIYYIQGKLVGETEFCADFLYQLSPIGDAHCQDVKITPSGSSVGSGIYIKADFYQKGIKKNKDNLGLGETIIIAMDNSSGNIIPNFNLYVNGVVSNNTLNLESGKSYDIRITSSSYSDLILNNLTTSEIPIDCEIINPKNVYETGDLIYFNSSIENVTYLINNAKVNNPFSLYMSGNISVKCIKENYIPKEFQINVIQSTSIGQCSPEQKEWKKGKEIICSLSKISDWEVINNGTLLESGTSNEVKFKIKNNGNLIINANGKMISNTMIEDSGIMSWIKKNWIISLVSGAIILGAIILIIRNKNKDEDVDLT